MALRSSDDKEKGMEEEDPYEEPVQNYSYPALMDELRRSQQEGASQGSSSVCRQGRYNFTLMIFVSVYLCITVLSLSIINCDVFVFV